MLTWGLLRLYDSPFGYNSLRSQDEGRHQPLDSGHVFSIPKWSPADLPRTNV